MIAFANAIENEKRSGSPIPPTTIFFKLALGGEVVEKFKIINRLIEPRIAENLSQKAVTVRNRKLVLYEKRSPLPDA